MTFDLLAILVFFLAALVYAGLLPVQWRSWSLLAASVIAIFWLQPPLAIRFGDFILPALTVAITMISWWLTRKPEESSQAMSSEQDRRTAILVTGLVFALSLMRYVDADLRITASRPPPSWAVLFAGLAIAAVIILLFRRLGSRMSSPEGRRPVLSLAILAVIVLFVVLKMEAPATSTSRLWRAISGQDTNLASPVDLGWLGFSFVAFRLIHTMRDRQTGLLPVLSLREYVTYVIFFPAYTSGPIDRAERFLPDFRALPEMVGLDPARFGLGMRRIVTGLFKKFVVADTLAAGASLNAINAAQADSTAGLWLLLYGYAFRLYFDFAGYTDIAIGLGILFGIRLPENFDRPYLTTSITAFWQRWHITLSNWVRFYVFSPLSRWLLSRRWRPSSTVIVLTAQLSTMIVIGLWHGITLNFFIWGIWHGIGLFIHKQWSDRTRKWYRRLGRHPWRKRVWTGFAWFVTFQFVVLGWVWFAMPTLNLSLKTFAGLFGLSE